MNIVTAVIMGVIGLAAGWFIPVIAQKAAEYKFRKKNKDLVSDPRFISPLLKIGCLLLNGICWAAAGMFLENPFHALLLAIILLDAIVIAIVDLRIHIIPNECVFVMALAGVIFQITYFGIAAIIPAVIATAAVMFVFIMLGSFLGFNAIGAGDVKLAGAMGLSLGWPHLSYGLMGMSILILVWCVIGLLTKKLKLKSMLPFGPFMMAGTIFASVYIIFG